MERIFDTMRKIKKLFLRLRRILDGRAHVSLRQKMTFIVLSVSTFTLIVLSVISFYGMMGTRDMAIKYGNDIGRQSDQNSSELLTEIKKKDLMDIVTDKADDINHRLTDMEKVVQAAAVAMKKIHDHPQNYAPRPISTPPDDGAGKITFYMQYAPDINIADYESAIAVESNIEDTLSTLITIEPKIDSIFVTSPKNYTLSADNNLTISADKYTPSELHYDAVSRDWYKLAVQKRDVSFTPVRKFVFSGNLGIFCAVPFYDDNDDLIGVACMQSTLTSLNAFVQDVNLRSAGFCFVVDDRGYVILSSAKNANDPNGELSVNLSEDRRNSANVSLAESVKAMTEGQKGITEVTIDGIKYYLAYSPIKQTDWSFAAAINEGEIADVITKNNENIQNLTNQNITMFNEHMVSIMLATVLLILGSLGVVSIIGRKISDKFVDPIHVLSEGVREIATGNLNKKINIHTGDEIEHLAICFNGMTDNLKQYMDNLSRATKEQERQNAILRKKNSALSSALRNVERLRIARDNYRAESETDKLTNLYNKITVERLCGKICQELPSDQQAAFFIIDLDHFKEVNDTYGHQYGDRILSEFAMNLKIICGKEDCLGRFGGDEFLVMMTGNPDENEIRERAHSIQQAARELLIDGNPSGVTASIGIAVAPHHGKDYETLFQMADKALYRVKQQGRDGFCLGLSEKKE